MTHSRVALIAVTLLVGPVTDAAAQMILQGPASAPQQSPPPCMNEFLPLRAEAEKRATTLKAGIERKMPPSDLCQLFRRFAEAEDKVVKYAVTNQTTCSIPPQAVTEMKANHGKTVQIRDKVCANADLPKKPPGPNLGEALGTRTLPTAETTTTGRGTLDTLTGNPLAR